MTGRLYPRGTIDEKESVVDLMFLTQFREKHRGDRIRSRRIQPNVEQAVRIGIDGSVQSLPFRIELNHSLTERDVIRIHTVCRL